MNHLDLLFPLVGALWACATLNLHVTRYLNEIRNVVIIGEFEGSKIDREIVSHMTKSDWFSMYTFIVAVDIAFGFLILLSPFLINSDERTFITWVLCIIVSAIPIAMGVLWFWHGLADYKIMKRAVAGD